MPKIFLTFSLLLFLLSGCATPPEQLYPEFEAVGYDRLPGWNKDNQLETLAAFKKSCERILKRSPDTPFGRNVKMIWAGTYGDWQPACRAMTQNLFVTPAHARTFFERYFTPYQVSAGRQKDGLFTGYYQPLLHGSMTRGGAYQTPLRALPDDLIMVDLSEFRDDLKGRRIAGRVQGNRLKPYESREEIMAGGMPKEKDQPIVWVDDPVDAFFLHIQGSGKIQLDTGEVLYVGYAGQNGHPYYAIGRALIESGDLTRETVSMQAIRDWLVANPDQATELMNRNPSYVFFRQLDVEGAIGGEGLPLTPLRSLAVDHTLYPYGLPVWLDVAHPQEGAGDIRQLMIAQDTGGAIRGPIRGDFFWGAGKKAEELAGKMKSKGKIWVLLPKTISLKSE